MDNKPNSFKFPARLLDQIRECSKGFFLFVIDENGAIVPYHQLDDTVSHLAMINYLEIFSMSMQQSLREQPLDDDGSLPEFDDEE